MAITVTHSKVSAIPDGTDTSVVRPSDWNATHTLVGVGTAASLDAGVANGVATLDSGGQVPLSQLPPLGDLNYQGAWNANTNSPTLTSSTGTKGYYYVVSVAGTTNLNGITDWQIGDWAVFNGSVWQKIDNTDAVTSVNGYTGTIVLTAADVGAVPYTGATTAVDLNAKTLTNIAHLGLNSTAVPDILFRAYGDNNSTSRIAIRGYSSNASSSSMRIAKFRGTYAAPQAPLSGDSLGKFELAGYGTTSANGYPQASYEGVATENWGATARGAKALFYVTPNTTITQAVALTINQDSTATFANTVTANGVLLTGNIGTVTSVSATAGTGISVSGSPITTSGTLTITNTAPDQTVAFTNGTGISVTGTYPNFTVTNTAPSSGGTVTSVTGTAPVVSSGGNTPAISMAAATTSVSGYLTSTDWNTFNGKGSGSVTSLATAGTVNGLTLTGGPITTTGTVTLGGTLDLSSPPTIGNTAPNTGKFTTLESTGTASLGTTSTTYVQIVGDASYPMVKATGGTNTPLVLSPLGTGALQAQKTDSTATGGNARGANAVDWQTSRGTAGSVASGTYATVSGGFNNSAGGQAGTVVGGNSNVAGGNYAFIGGGIANQTGGAASGNYGAIVGGNSNAAGGLFNFIGGGYTNSGTSGSAVTTNTTTIAVTAGTTLYLSSTNANIKVGQYITGTGISSFTYATSTVTTGTAAVMNTSTISGTTLTVGSLASGTIIAGQVLTGTGVTAGTYIVSGSASTWTVSVSQTVTSTTITGTAYTFTISQAATTAAGVTLSFYTPHGVVVGGGNNQATGSYSFIGGGGDAGTAANRNAASGDWTVICGGKQNIAGTTADFIGGGTNNSTGVTTAGNAVICGGSGNAITSYNASILGGSLNVGNSPYSAIMGGVRGTARAITGNAVFPACISPVGSGVGNNQAALLILGKQTTDATATVLTCDGAAAGTTNQVILPNNSAYTYKATGISTAQFVLATTATSGSAGTATITFAAQTVAPFIVGQSIVVAGVTPTGYNGTQIVTACTTTSVSYTNATTGAQTVAGTVTGTSFTSSWKIEGAIMRSSSAAGTRLVGSPTTTVLAQDTQASTWTLVASADTTNGGLKFTFTGAAGTTIRTVVKVDTTEVTY